MVATILALTASCALAAPADDFQYRVEDKTLWVTAPGGRSYRIEIPCSGVATATHAGRLYVACGDEGMAVLSIESPSTPQLLGVRDLGATVVGFHEAGGALWAELTRREARLVGGPEEGAVAGVPPGPVASAPGPAPSVPAPPKAGPAAIPPAPSGPPSQAPAVEPQPLAPPRMVPMGEVVEVRGSRAIVTLGRSSGLAPGDRVALYVLREVPLGAGQVATSEDVLVVGTATVVGADRAEVELGMDERVALGARARRTSAPVTASRWLPSRPAGVWEVAFTLRPFIGIGTFGVGTVSDASVGVRLPSDVHLAAMFEPLGVALAKEGNVVAAAGNVIAAYDTRYFEVGLGAGWSTVGTDVPPPGSAQVRSGFSLAQVARLGAEDGLHLAARNTFLLYRSEFHYGGTVGELMVPVADRASVFGRGGGGGPVGFVYGELGLRLLVSGNGGPDSLFVSASLGGAGLWSDDVLAVCPGPTPGGGRCFEEVSYAGPMVGIGVEWRP